MSGIKSFPKESSPGIAPELHAFLNSRRSIRRFLTRPVPDLVIQRILETTAHAPSAHNRQPWRFVVVTANATKAHLADSLAVAFRHDLAQDRLSPGEIEVRIEKSRARITSSPVLIVLNLDASDMDVYPDERRKKAEFIMAVQSVAAAGLQLLLAAHAEGLGAVWTCSPLFAPKVVCESLQLPDAWEPQALFFIGYPDEKPKLKQLIPYTELTRFL